MASVKVTADDVNFFVANLTTVYYHISNLSSATLLKTKPTPKTEFNSLVAVEAVNISG